MAWAARHLDWIRALRFESPLHQVVLTDYLHEVARVAAAQPTTDSGRGAYSVRSATAGSTATARRNGIAIPAKDAMPRTPNVTTTASGSMPSTPNRSVSAIRAVAPAPANPTAADRPVRRIVSFDLSRECGGGENASFSRTSASANTLAEGC